MSDDEFYNRDEIAFGFYDELDMNDVIDWTDVPGATHKLVDLTRQKAIDISYTVDRIVLKPKEDEKKDA